MSTQSRDTYFMLAKAGTLTFKNASLKHTYTFKILQLIV